MRSASWIKLSLLVTAASLAVVGPGCAGPDDDEDDYSEATWSALSTEDTGPAVLDDGAALEDAAEPPADLDTTDDLEEAANDDVDPEAEREDESEAAPGVGTASLDPQAGAAKTFQNSVYGNCADPGVIKHGDLYVAACTGGGYPLFSSTDLVRWTPAGHIFSTKNRPKWASKNFWAPEIHHVGAGFVAYFAAFSPKHDAMCIGAARSASVTGPFKDLGRPLVCQKGVGLIDVNMFTDGKGNQFLYYKTEGNALRPQKKTILYGHRLGADGVSFVGKRHKLLQNDLRWEGDVVEAPFVVNRGKYYFMFYSGYRYCNGTYGVGVARATSPLGPFRKKGAPILHSNATWSGPGHNSVVRTNGHDWIVYHAWKGAHSCDQGGNRALMIDRISWAKGWPSVNSGSPSRGRHTAP